VTHREADPEAFEPLPKFEEPVGSLDESETLSGKNIEAPPPKAQVGRDPEAFRPRPEFEASVDFLDEVGRPLRVGEDPEFRADEPPPGGEAFVPRAGFEDFDGEARYDPEQFEPRPDFESEERKQPKVPEPPRDVLSAGEMLLGERPVRGRFEGEGRLSRMGDAGLSLKTERALPLLFEFSVASPRLEEIVGARKKVRVLAVGRDTPVGRSTGLSIASVDQLEYVFERRLGPRGLMPRDRGGLKVRPLLDRRGKPVFRGPCRESYEVPTEFAGEKGRIELAAGQRGELVLGGKRYTIAVSRSLAHFRIECGASFELPPHELEYVLWSQ
jgi:hypothetical protein